MSLQGLPDFQRPLHGFKYEIYYPFENAGSFVVASSALEIGGAANGKPDFLLELVRGVSPALPPKPYAVLDFRVRAVHPAADALALVRRQHAGATVAPPVFRGGFLRLHTVDTGEIPPELFQPVAIAANGLGVSRFTARLGPLAGAVIEGALKGEVLGLLAWAEMELVGVAPRVPVRVRFDPQVLLTALAKLAPDASNPVITRDQLEKFFEQSLSKLPLRLEGNLEELARRDFTDAMADLVRVQFGEFVASPKTPVEFCLSLRMQAAVPGEVEWDLSEPVAAPRALVASLDPFEAARQLVATGGIGQFVKQTLVPPLSGGTRRVHVAANLPAARVGIARLGVHVTAPPRPPHRMQAIQQTVELIAPEDGAVVTMKLSVAEPLEYEYVTWAVTTQNGAVERLEAPRRKGEGEMLDLGVDDFPLLFVTVGASSALLKAAAIHGVCSGSGEGRPFSFRFTLSAEQPVAAMAVRAGAVLAPLEIEARELAGSAVLGLKIEASQSALLDLGSFPGFGPQRVEVECDFRGASAGLVAVDLVAEGSEDVAGASQTLAVTPASPRKEWGYLAVSPFHSGYRYRMRKSAADPAPPWSEVQPASRKLFVRLEE
jgi:hypothetical protein